MGRKLFTPLKASRLSSVSSGTIKVIFFSLKCSQRACLPLLLKERTEKNLGLMVELGTSFQDSLGFTEELDLK